MKPTLVCLALSLSSGSLAAQTPVPFALERVVPLPVQVADTQVTLDKLGDLFVVAPDYFVFTAHAAIPSPGAFNTGWGTFSWKAGSLKTVLLDTKAFQSPYGLLHEKASMNPDRSTYLPRDGQLYFSVGSGWMAFTPDQHKGWSGGIYAWDGHQIRKVLAPGDAVTLGGKARSVKSANLLAVAPGGACLAYLRTGQESGLALVKDGIATPWLLEKAPLPGQPDLTVSAIDRILATSPEGDSVFALLEPRRGETFLAQITATATTRILDLNGPDPTDPASRLYHIARGEAADGSALAFWAYIYKNGKVDMRLGRLYLWDRGQLQAVYGTPENRYPAGPEDAREELVYSLSWVDPAHRHFLALLKRRIDGNTVGYTARYFDGMQFHEVSGENLLPNILPRTWPVPGVPGTLALSGFFSPNVPRGPWQPVSGLFENRPPYRLLPGPERVSANGVRFRPTAVRGGEGQRLVLLLPDGFYLSK